MKVSHVVIVQIGTVDGIRVHMNSLSGRGVEVSVGGGMFTVSGGGLSESYDLDTVERFQLTPDSRHFGLMAPGEVTGLLIPEQGMHLVRIDAKAFGHPSKSDLRRLLNQVTRAMDGL